MTKKVSSARAPARKADSVVRLNSVRSRRREIAVKAARASGDSRSGSFEAKVRAAMEALEAEIEAAGGVENLFPKGLTKKAVTEKAGVAEGSLHSKKQKTLGEEVGTWVDKQNGVTSGEQVASGSEAPATESKSRSLQTRYSDLKKKWQTVLQDIRDTKLAMMALRHEMEAVQAENTQLAMENAGLRAELESLKSGQSKVARLPRRK